jgi:ubiquinone/menaquinone biosynthesis C-methylase UbiE
MQDAFRIWDNAAEPLASVEARIHDGAPIEKLRQRAAGYVSEIVDLLPARIPPDAAVVEVGPGVAYIMQAFAERTGVRRITGLDVAPNMVERARERLARDGVPSGQFDFVVYDGTTFPWPDASIDIFYSVATIQHIPKPFAYNVLFEMQRCLTRGGRAVVHLLSWDLMKHHDFSFVDEVRRQISGEVTHWHHFYDAVELEAVATHGIKPSSHKIVARGGSIWMSWTK